MIYVPKQLEKYFLSPFGKAKLNTKSVDKINEYLRQQMGLGEVKDVLPIKTSEMPKSKFFILDDSTCMRALSGWCWSNLKEDDKARVVWHLINREMRDTSNKADTPKLSLYPTKKQVEKKCDAMFTSGTDNTVYLNPKFIAHKQGNGAKVASLIGHELQHAKDFRTCRNEIIPYITGRYTRNKNFLTARGEIEGLPVEGQIYNYATQEYESVTPELREKLLFAKHYICAIKPEAENVKKIDEITTRKQLRNTLEYLAYRYTPLEKRAFDRGAKLAKIVADNNAKMGEALSSDFETANAERKSIEHFEEQMKMLEKITKIKMHTICDLFSKRSFYDEFAPNTGASKENKEEVDQLVETIFGKVAAYNMGGM